MLATRAIDSGGVRLHCVTAGRSDDPMVLFLHGVGHDMGGGLAWGTAMTRPDLVSRLAILNSVHPIGFEREIRKWSQLKKSWYVFFFLIPRIPEWFLSRRDFRFVRRSLAEDGLSREDIDDLLEGVRSPRALRAAIDWYRASFGDGVRGRIPRAKVEIPTLVVWGDKEQHLNAALADPPADWVSSARVVHIPEASHWVHHDAPDKVATLLTEHFAPA